MSIKVIEWAYGQGQVEELDTMKGSCVLAALNAQTMDVNDKVYSLTNVNAKGARNVAR